MLALRPWLLPSTSVHEGNVGRTGNLTAQCALEFGARHDTTFLWPMAMHLIGARRSVHREIADLCHLEARQCAVMPKRLLRAR